MRHYWHTARKYCAVLLLVSCCVASYAAPQPSGNESGDYAQAEALIRGHQWDRGLAILKVLRDATPDNPKILNLTGLGLIGKGNPGQANQYFHRALKIDPAFLPAMKNLAINEFDMGHVREAEQLLSKAAAQSPDDPVINLYLGKIAYRQHNLSRSAKFLPRAGELLYKSPATVGQLTVSELETGQTAKAHALLDRIHPGDLAPPLRFALGVALAKSGDAGRAIAFFQSLHHEFPGSYNVSYNLAVCYISDKQYAQAVEVVSQVIAEGHETAEIDRMQADAYQGEKQTQAAIDVLRRAISLAPGDVNSYIDFATLCINHGDYAAGLKVIQVGLKVKPKSSKLIFERGILYGMQDKYELAEKDFERSTQLAPQTQFGYIGLGIVYLEAGDVNHAIQVLRQRVHQSPNNASLLYLLGEALIRSGVAPGSAGFQEAQTSLEKSVRLNPSLSMPHVSLGNTYMDENRLQDAVNQFETARRLDPTNKSAYAHLAVAYRRLKETAKARQVLVGLEKLTYHGPTESKTSLKVNDSDGQAKELQGPE